LAGWALPLNDKFLQPAAICIITRKTHAPTPSIPKLRYAAAGLDLLTWDWIPTHPIPRCVKPNAPTHASRVSTLSRLSPSERHRNPPFLLTITYAASQCPDCIRQSARPAYYLFPESATVDAHDAARCEMWEHGIIGDVRHIAHEWSSHGFQNR
jgi:hypothetical protein